MNRNEKYIQFGNDMCKKLLKDLDIAVVKSSDTYISFKVDRNNYMQNIMLHLQNNKHHGNVLRGLAKDKLERLDKISLPKSSFINKMDLFSILHEIGHIVDFSKKEDILMSNEQYKNRIKDMRFYCGFIEDEKRKAIKMSKIYRRITEESFADTFAISIMENKLIMNYIKCRILQLENS